MFPLGVIAKKATDGIVDHGLYRDFKFNWSIPEGQALVAWLYNWDSGSLTTGLRVELLCKHFGVWLRD